MRTEPPPSEVVASGTMPAASAAADPPLDPAGDRSRFQGLRVLPKRRLVVNPVWANAGVFDFPTTMAPAARSRATTRPSAAAGGSVGQPVAAHRGGHAGDVDQILDQDRKPGERSGRVDPFGIGERLLRPQANDGVHRWVVGLDAPQCLGDQLPGVQLARSNPLDQLGPHRNLPLVEQ
jgi:hypothetical protein